MAAFKGTEVSESEEEKEQEELPPFPDAKTCSLCREQGSNTRPLGYVAFVQPSNLLMLVKKQRQSWGIKQKKKEI